MKKVLFSVLALFVMANGSDYDRANAAAKEAMSDLDCDFGDCAKNEPKVIIKEKIVEKPVVVEKIIEKPVIVEKVIVKEKVIEKPVEKIVEKVVYKDREVEKVVYKDKPAKKVVQVETIPAPVDSKKRVYDASFDIPVIGVKGTSFYYHMEKFHIVDDKVKVRSVSDNGYLKSQSRPAWAMMKLKGGKSLFLSKYDATIPFYKESITQINFHVELPDNVISNDSTIVALPNRSYKNNSGRVEEFSVCTFNNYLPNDAKLQSVVQLNGKKYLDVKCSVDLYNYNTQRSTENTEIQNMIQAESFEFVPVYRVFPPIRKGSKKAILGKTLKKFIFASEIDK